MLKYIFCPVLFCVMTAARCQSKTETRNLIVITLDGFRWQEVFHGADQKILRNTKYTKDARTLSKFEAGSSAEGRSKLLPFFWSTIGRSGQLYGNRDLGNYFNCSNPYWFSYPGYHELLVGAMNRKVCSNLKIENPDVTVLEFLNRQKEYHNSVAAFATWDVLPYILAERCSGIPVNSGMKRLSYLRPLSDDEKKMNAVLESTRLRTDSITFHFAFANIQQDRTKIAYISLDETDHYAHADRYDLYLEAAHRTDEWIGELWNWIQSNPGYKNCTTMVITTDHGRGRNSGKSWRHHGRLTLGSDEIWMAVIGPDTPPIGEVRVRQQLYQKQIAGSLSAFVGCHYSNLFPVGEPIGMLLRPAPLFVQNQSDPKTSHEENTNYLHLEGGQPEK